MNECVKTCKKHGNLSVENTYLMKTKYGTSIRMCLICKKQYRNDWAKRNPDKVKITQNKVREKRLLELENGTLSLTCKTHGELPIDRIRIDARGTRVCKLCSNEQKRVSKKKVDPDYEKYKKWFYSDKERIKRYYKNDYSKKLIRQKKAYYRLKETNPEKYKLKELMKRKWAKKSRKRLDDCYITTLLRTIRYGGKKNRFYHYLKGAEFPKELIELIKLQIEFKRKLREKNVKNREHEPT